MVSLKKYLLVRLANILMWSRLCSLFNIEIKEFRMKFHPSHLSKRLWREQYLQENCFDLEESFFRCYLKPGDVCIDVGANIGYLTLLSSVLVGATGKVYAFEPNPKIYRYLQTNIALNQIGNVTSFNVAVGNKDGETCLMVPRKKDHYSYIVSDSRGRAVSMKKLDSIGIEDESIALLKLDVEGYEKYVLEGAADLLKKTKCVYFEAVPRNAARYNYTISDLVVIFKKHGFDIFELHDNHLKDLSGNNRSHPSTPNLIGTRDISELLKRTNYRY